MEWISELQITAGPVDCWIPESLLVGKNEV